jgi:hypothetical protein
MFVNNSSRAGNVCLYQQDINIGVLDIQSVAWFSKFSYPTTSVTFTWTTDYNFVWTEKSELSPEAVFISGQCWAANLITPNQVTLIHREAYNFENLTTGSNSGGLYIIEDETIPLKQASVGIGMSGLATFVTPALPNVILNFTPHPQYWITFGNYTQGEVLNLTEIANPAQIDFPPNVYSMMATLGQTNKWLVEPASA